MPQDSLTPAESPETDDVKGDVRRAYLLAAGLIALVALAIVVGGYSGLILIALLYTFTFVAAIIVISRG